MSMAKLLEPFGGGLSCDDPSRNVFDIHGGGIDLVFPHHENEIAQSCCAFGSERMANVWMHNGFLQVEGEKMSKSLGNFVTIRDLIDTTAFGGRKWPGEVLRLAMLRTHYRQPIDWTVRALEESERILDRWYEAVGDAGPADAVAYPVLDALTRRSEHARGDLRASRDRERNNAQARPSPGALPWSLRSSRPARISSDFCSGPKPSGPPRRLKRAAIDTAQVEEPDPGTFGRAGREELGGIRPPCATASPGSASRSRTTRTARPVGSRNDECRSLRPYFRRRRPPLRGHLPLEHRGAGGRRLRRRPARGLGCRPPTTRAPSPRGSRPC